MKQTKNGCLIIRLPLGLFIIRSMKYFFFVTLIFFNCKLSSQTIASKYDLNFDSINECDFNWFQDKKNCKIEKRNDVLNIIYSKISAPENMEWKLSNQIILPQKEYNKLTVTLKTKNSSDSNILFTVVGIDNNEKIAFQKTTSIKKSNDWTIASLSSVIKTTKAINILIQYKGTAIPSQAMELEKVGITIDGKDFTKIPVSFVEKPFASLAFSKAVSILPEYNGSLQRYIPDIDTRKIFGLGESTHGSKSIMEVRLAFLKNLVRHHNCRLILMEVSYDNALLFDLYVQGIIADKTLIEEYLKLYPGYRQLLNMIDWMREYNRTSSKMVHILAIDNINSAPSFALMDYYVSLLRYENAKPFLHKIYANDFLGVAVLSKKDSLLQKKIGPDNFKSLIHILSDKSFHYTGDFFTNRDSLMYIRTTYLDSLFLKPKEKIAILAHAIHLQKNISLNNDTFFRTLGSFLSQNYKDQYYAIDINFGSGSFIQDSCSTLTKTVDSLYNIPKNSFEFAAQHIPYNIFFYPVKYLDDNIVTTAYILRAGSNKSYFKYASLKKRFDAIFFLQKSAPFLNFEENTFMYWMHLRINKGKKYQEIRKQYILEQMNKN